MLLRCLGTTIKIMRSSILFFFLLSLPFSGFSQNDFKNIFDKYSVTGSTTIYDLKKDKWIYTDEADSKAGTRPASTFKIINSLIALETGVIKDELELITFVGIENVDTSTYGNRTEIFKDMNLAEAFEKSAVWFHIELAKKIGREKYKNFFMLCGYGNMDFSQEGVDFWNKGNFQITPQEQILFLKNLYEEKLPFSKRTMTIVKKIMITELGDNYIIRAKTGYGIYPDQSFGWWVGYVERKKNVYFFATRIRMPSTEFSPKFAQARKELTKDILNKYKLLK